MNTPMILLYNLDTPKGAKIKMMCLSLKIRTLSVKREDLHKKLAVLSGRVNQSETEYADEGFDDEMLVMVNFTNEAVTKLLKEFRSRKIPPVALKAVLTPSNAEWNSIELHEELVKEHEAMILGRQAHEQEEK